MAEVVVIVGCVVGVVGVVGVISVLVARSVARLLRVPRQVVLAPESG